MLLGSHLLKKAKSVCNPDLLRLELIHPIPIRRRGIHEKILAAGRVRQLTATLKDAKITERKIFLDSEAFFC